MTVPAAGIEAVTQVSSAGPAGTTATDATSWRRYRWHATVAGLGLATLATRLPFLYRTPFNVDSANYILALGHFDLSIDQPHPPGNPLYVLLGRLANLAFPDPNQALVAVSVASSVVAVCALAYLGAALYNPRIGLWAAAFLAINPFFWLNGEIALAYTTEAAAATVLALLAWRAYTRPGPAPAALLGVLMALAGGLRPTLLPLLALLYLFGLWRATWRDRALSVAVAAAGTLGWLVPLVAVSGGVWSYLKLLRDQALVAGSGTALFSAPLRDWLDDRRFFVVTLATAVNLLGALALIDLFRRRHALHRRPSARAVFLWLWVLPPTATYILIHFGQIGYILLLLPPLFLLCLPVVDRGLTPVGRLRPPSPALAACVLTALVLAIPMLRVDEADNASWDRIDRIVRALPPDRTVILTWVPGAGSYRVAGYLFSPDLVMGVTTPPGGAPGVKYEVSHGTSTFRLDPALRACPMAAAGGATHVVVLDTQVTALVPDPASWHSVALPNGNALMERDVPAGVAYVDLSSGRLDLRVAGSPPPAVARCSQAP